LNGKFDHSIDHEKYFDQVNNSSKQPELFCTNNSVISSFEVINPIQIIGGIVKPRRFYINQTIDFDTFDCSIDKIIKPCKYLFLNQKMQIRIYL
jgi:hypothetical protein